MKKAKILFVVTSHSELGDTGMKTGVWFEEVTTPYFIFQEAGFKVTIASVQGGKIPIDPASLLPEWDTKDNQRFNNDSEALKAFNESYCIAELNAEAYDQVYFPGGHGPMWDFVDNVEIKRLLSHFMAQDKPVGSLCHGVAAMTNAVDLGGLDYLKGKRLTAFSNAEEIAMKADGAMPFMLETRLTDLGAIFSQGENFAPFTVVDGNLVTGQNPASSAALAREMVKLR